MDDELKAMPGRLVSAFEAERSENARFRAEVRARLDGPDKRLDDQGRILAALIPSRIAAVPPPAAE
ncbi:hypothetical protein [Azospirillum halopraeferens]|uniref:hypothetical protein n=1 Tax=Azospirillum halopraeferens TaxID=34010 RepID=UPI00048CD417|nr:hypothetical protein [Azospirillum halopraeferens]